jgi:hypothetical protein
MAKSGASRNQNSQRCTATTSQGAPCRAWAVRGSDPPRCAPHGGGSCPVGAPADNDNARVHGYYAMPDKEPQSIEEVIADLSQKQAALSGLIANGISNPNTDLTKEDLVKIFAIHGQNASRLGKLLRDQRALSGEAADGIAAAIGRALDELSTELGVDL